MYYMVYKLTSHGCCLRGHLALPRPALPCPACVLCGVVWCVCRTMLERQLYIALSSSSWAIGFGALLTLLFTGPTFGIRAVRGGDTRRAAIIISVALGGGEKPASCKAKHDSVCVYVCMCASSCWRPLSGRCSAVCRTACTCCTPLSWVSSPALRYGRGAQTDID
jgi:hypothetical protein